MVPQSHKREDFVHKMKTLVKTLGGRTPKGKSIIKGCCGTYYT